MSPATNTPGTELMYRPSRATLPRSSNVTPSCSSHVSLLRPDEAHRQEDEVGRQLAIAALDLLEATVDHLHVVQQQGAHPAVAVVDEPLGVDAEHAVTALLVRRRDAIHEAPLRPRVVGGADVGRAGHDLELRHARRALAVHGAEAVGAGVAAADDHDVLAMHVDGRHIDVAFLHPIGQRQVLHRLMDAAQLAPWYRQIAACGRAARQHDRVVRRQQHFDVDAVTDRRVACGTRCPRPPSGRCAACRWRFSILNSGIP